MNKYIIVILSFILVLCMAFAGCNVGKQNELQSKIDELQSQIEENIGTQSELQSKIDELQSQLEEMNEKLSKKEEQIKQMGNELAKLSDRSFYALQTAYDYGWFNEDDLKSIACCYNDFQQKENPYSGMYEQPAEGLSQEVENEIKQAYLNQIVEYPEGLLERVKINYYYGTYNGNIVIRIYSHDFCIDPLVEEEVYIGNVVFKSWWDAQTWVYHIS